MNIDPKNVNSSQVDYKATLENATKKIQEQLKRSQDIKKNIDNLIERLEKLEEKADMQSESQENSSIFKKP